MIAHLLALGLLSSGSAAPTQLPVSLTCTGDKVSVVDGARSRTPWNNELRIDLARNRWCEADCRRHHPIVAMKPDFIDLIDEVEDGAATRSHLNRSTGGFTLLSRGRRNGHAVEIGVLAQCNPGGAVGTD